MNTKKWLAVGTCASMLGMFSACSDEKKNPVIPDDPESSSSAEVVPNSSGEVNPNSSSVTTASSSSVTNLMSSSSNPEDTILDSNATYMGVSEIMYNAPGGSALEWIEVYIKNGPDLTNMQLSNVRLDGIEELAK